MGKYLFAVICICSLMTSNAFAAFGGKPPLKSDDSLRRELAPYDIAEVNYLGMNYCENLLDMRNNIVSYTHMGFDSVNSDAWHLHFPDDTARLLEGIAWEADFSPVARIELARRIAKGLISAHVPGTKGYYFFRQRSGGKSELTFDDVTPKAEGRVMLSTWGDAIGGEVKVGFRAETNNQWYEINQFKYKDNPEKWGDPGTARSAVNWNKSPYTFKRSFSLNGKNIDFTGKYWMSDEDMPLQYEYTSKDVDTLQIVIGEPDRPMPLLALGDANMPGIINLPDRKTSFESDKTGDKVIANPDFNYLILSKKYPWAAPGFLSSVLVMWDGKPDKIEALAKNGFGEIRISYSRTNDKTGGKVWLFPFPIVNPDDMEHIYRNAESFFANGKLIHNGFPPQQAFNALPSGLAAGAYILSKYNDPMAPTIRAHAINAVDETFEAEIAGRNLIRVFFPVRSAAWMIKTAKVMGDQQMVDKYTKYLAIAMKRMLSTDVGYDGKGWPGGWDHFNSTKAAWLAYDATGNQSYLDAFNRALTVYTIDKDGIYRYGNKMPGPGGFDTYFGSMPMGVWGVAGKIDWANQLLDLNVPCETGSKIMAKELWHDDGNGPWSQDDANPEYVGLSLKGLNIPQGTKHLIPVGSFPIYDASGNVELTRLPIIENPFFLTGKMKAEVIDSKDIGANHTVNTINLVPSGNLESTYIKRKSGKVIGQTRICSSTDKPLVYKFDASGMSGAGIDLMMKGDGFKIEASPDGKRWYERLDTWSSDMRTQSLDLSFLTGSRDELLKMLTVTPGSDKRYLAVDGSSKVQDGNCRYTSNNGSFVYKFDLPDVTECYIEAMVGNGYVVECSSDGITWKKEIDASNVKSETDAAWIRMIDVSKYIGNSMLYIRISNISGKTVYAKPAFLRRLSVYGIMKSDNIYVRISNVRKSSGKSFALNQITFRKWAE